MTDTKEIKDKFEELKKSGYWFWTKDLLEENEDSSLQELINTQKEFRVLLEKNSSNNIVEKLLHPEALLTLKLVITHLMRATDGSAELVDRIKDYINFNKISSLNIKQDKGSIRYEIKEIGVKFTRKLSNAEIAKAENGLAEDIITILLFGSQITEFEEFITFKKLRLGKIVGKKDELQKYFEMLYLKVSRQATGIVTAASGKGPQDVVNEKLQDYFKKSNSIEKVSGSRIKGIGSDIKGQQFDTVYEVKRNGKNSIFIAIEIAFQETTNSVIERKSKQAVQLFDIFNKKGFYLCFVVDGAGYFSRSKATKDIIKHSHLCITFKELDKLCKFIEKLLTT